jgi:PAS domain S-box-containing protein
VDQSAGKDVPDSSAGFDAAMRELAAIYALPWPKRVGLGIFGFLCGLGLRLAFQDVLGDRLAYVTFFPGAEIGALLGGLAPGLTAAVLSAATVHLWFVPLRDAGDWVGLATFSVSTAALSVIAEALHRTWRRLSHCETQRDDADRLLAANRSLLESEERFRAVVSSAMDAIIALDAEQNIILFNQAAETLFGCRAEEVIGTRIERFIPERFRAAHSGHVRLFGERGETTRPMCRRGPVQGLKANGEEFPIEASLSQCTLDGKRIFTIIMRDVTERRRAETALKEADRHKDEFLATLAHELRNPLAPIRNGLQVLRRSEGENSDTKRLHAIMERQADHLVRLVDDLLEISRISRGKIELRKERVDLASVIDHAIEMSSSRIEAAGLELLVVKPDEPLPLDADAVRLTQIFANLLNNAAKFTDPGGRIEVEAKREGGEAIVSVSDNGAGIAKDMLTRIFDPFAQVGGGGGARNKGGLGIGLALVRKLVELHGGSVEAKSDGEGCGACFVVRLPLSAFEAGFDGRLTQPAGMGEPEALLE